MLRTLKDAALSWNTLTLHWNKFDRVLLGTMAAAAILAIAAFAYAVVSFYN